LGGQEIAPEGGKILPKVSPELQAKFLENFVNFTKTATLVRMLRVD